jgi:ankyrin repeat protein
MEEQPEDILALLGVFLTFKDILALATTSKKLERKLLSSEAVNRQLAIHFGFPFGLSLTELKDYESRSLNDRFADASKIGDMRIVERLIELGADDYNSAMYSTASEGHKEIVERMLRLGADDYNSAMSSAARGGHIEIVERMLELGADDYNWIMDSAARGGHVEIVERMLQLGADNYDW